VETHPNVLPSIDARGRDVVKRNPMGLLLICAYRLSVSAPICNLEVEEVPKRSCSGRWWRCHCRRIDGGVVRWELPFWMWENMLCALRNVLSSTLSEIVKKKY